MGRNKACKLFGKRREIKEKEPRTSFDKDSRKAAASCFQPEYGVTG